MPCQQCSQMPATISPGPSFGFSTSSSGNFIDPTWCSTSRILLPYSDYINCIDYGELKNWASFTVFLPGLTRVASKSMSRRASVTWAIAVVLLVGSNPGCHLVYPGRDPGGPRANIPGAVPRELCKTT